MDNRLLLRPAEAADLMGISRSKCYALMASGQLPSVRLGASVRVPYEPLKAWISAQLGQGADSQPSAVGIRTTER